MLYTGLEDGPDMEEHGLEWDEDGVGLVDGAHPGGDGVVARGEVLALVLGAPIIKGNGQRLFSIPYAHIPKRFPV